MSFEEFAGDQKTVYAVTRALEIISEASRRLPDDLKLRHPAIDWPGAAAAGNVYRREYEVVDDALLWYIVQQSLTGLRETAVVELRRIVP
jgi:uncharacterized protein with HEPN domain